MLDRDEIVRLTLEHGRGFGLQHTNRLLHLVALLGQGMDYREEVVWLAAHLHDWGGYPPWVAPGVDHVARSLEVVEPFLAERGCPPDTATAVLECIRYHHGGPAGRSVESLLFTDADALDLLGTVGVCRTFAMWPRDIRAGYEAVRRYRAMSIAALSLPQSREMAAQRIAETDRLLEAFEEETFGMF